jgi:hypothetical protein
MRPADPTLVKRAIPISVDPTAAPAELEPLIVLLARLVKEPAATKSCEGGKSGGKAQRRTNDG